MAEPIFLDVASDRALITDVYSACDQWCMYCHVKQRCLAFRCSPELGASTRSVYETFNDRLREGVLFLKQLSEAGGRAIPEIDAILSDDPKKGGNPIDVSDPIERMGRRYAYLTNAYLLSRQDFPFEMTPRASGPTPFEVFAWYHMLVPAKISRALVSARRAARREAGRKEDALGCAKVALIGIDRSLNALADMATTDGDPRLDVMQAHLRRLRRELEARFPDARGFVRIGLDVRAPE